MMSGLINLFVGLSLWGSPVADPVASAASDFRKVNAVYAGNFSVSMDYYYFQDHTTTTAKESTSGYYLKTGEKSYSKLHNVETVRGSKSTIVADNNASNIVVLDAYKEANKQAITMGLDTMLRNCEKIDMVEASGTRVYTLHLGPNLSGDFNRISVTINMTNHTLSKIVLFYKNPVRSNVDSKEERRAAKPPRVEIVYKNFSASPAANAELFNESHYVSLSGKTYKGAGKYAKYTVYNQKLR